MSKATFESQYASAAEQAAAQLGTSPSALLAQWGLETGWGKSIIPGTNNLGNIKDFSGRGVAAVDNATGSTDKYRAYATTDEFVTDYVSLIKRKYPGAVNQKSAAGFAGALKAGGYAEDPLYVQKIAKLAGEPEPALPTPSQKYAAGIDAVRSSQVLKAQDQRAYEKQLLDEADKQRAEIAARPTGLEMFGAAMAGNTTGSIFGALFRDRHEAVDGFAADVSTLPKSADSDLIEDYGSARSPAEAADILSRYEEEQFRIRTLMDRGTGTGIGLLLGGEIADPLNWAVPYAAARAVGRAAGATVKGAVVENLLSGTALEVVKQSLQGDFRPRDLAISLVADSLIGAAVGSLSTLRKAEQVVEDGAQVGLGHAAEYAARAEAQVGAGASTSDLRRVMDDLEKADLNSVVKAAADPNPVADSPLATALAPSPQSAASPPAPLISPRESFDAGWSSTSTNAEAEFDSLGKIMFNEMGYSGANGAQRVSAYSGGVASDLDSLKRLPAGVHISSNVSPSMATSIRAVEKIAERFLERGTVITVHADAVEIPWARGTYANAAINQVTPKVAMIRVNPAISREQQLKSVTHEMGHAIFNQKIATLKDGDKAKLMAAFERFLTEAAQGKNGDAALSMRFSALNENLRPAASGTSKDSSAYFLNWDEFSAEQFAKFVAQDAVGANKVGLGESAIRIIKRAVAEVLEFLKLSKRQDVPVSQEYREFFESLMNDPVAGEAVATQRRTLSLPRRNGAQLSVPARPAAVVNELMTDPDALKYGLTLAPVSTAAERKQAQVMLALHKQADIWAASNPMDQAWMDRAKNLSNNSVFNVASTGLLMLTSPSPLVRMIANNLVEDASGIAGNRRATAAISKHLNERLMMGNVLNDVQKAYDLWSAGRPNVRMDNWNGGKVRREFDVALATEIEARRAGGAGTTDPQIMAAANSLEMAYQRIANAQRQAGTLGAGGLPESSRGYMPHRMSPKAIMNLTNEQSQVVHGSLVDQFVTIEGWDITFSDKLATAYMKRIRDRAAGDYGSNIGGGASHTELEEALRAMDLPEDTIASHMAKFTKGAAGFTKKRIELDLNKVYELPSGPFRLMDIFEVDQIALLRSQAGRASGEVALTKFGVQGKPGAKLLRDAMQYGADGQRATVRDKESYDQVIAEFFNEPFGGHTGKFVERAMAANSLVRLGGIVYNQFAESINGIVHVGAARALSSVAAIPRLRAEIIDLAAGKQVKNGLLESIELAGGAEFGTDAYKFVMPFDSPDHAYPTYGQDTLTLTDRLLRGGGYLQGKLSGWRLIHSAQQRGMAEQIVHKMARYIRDGKDDIALDQFGINATVRAELRKELNQIAKWQGDNLIEWDVTKISNPDIREQVIQAVWRGTSQIIQGTYIGERGKWAHDGLLKLLTQFRTFSLTSMEKQWGRQRNSRGKYAAFGIVMGAMAFAAPIYMARVHLASIGRPDREAYIEERLQPANLARATLNYVAAAGMAGDFMDLTSSMLPESFGIAPTGGRAGVETAFVGNYIAPSLSLVDDAWKYAQSPLEMDDLSKVLPGRNLPFLVPFMNALKD